ncbi:hypothetical protein EZH22_07350 [Xanthobacter dioxanivorans]|uniref:Uncharacterized protein n=1 Tax=Xanthobacter dioxanivorans TaxID=2528964 RepID=A0A974SL32_9HYPH|nr:hypothetical protein [Xanthobacter dioxanivorans]QRG08138.1 hypothetical protein EZH22_07350 [Xanthobacter dioxanivorans]
MNRRLLLAGLAGGAVGTAAGAAGFAGAERIAALHRPRTPGLLDGVVWQVHGGALDPRGDWDFLGARSLLVQWLVADDTAFVPLPGLGLSLVADPPNWTRIAREPWARSIIAGLASRFSEPTARKQVLDLGALSARIARQPLPFRPAGFYFPVEADPTWAEVGKMAAATAAIPRPLWVSCYDNSNVGPEALADWIENWLPKDVGLFFQDGVGVYTRAPLAARRYAEVISARLGARRFRLIAEAFRPAETGTFRAATAEELLAQLKAYEGFDTFVFDGPHYVDRILVQKLLKG